MEYLFNHPHLTKVCFIPFIYLGILYGVAGGYLLGRVHENKRWWEKIENKEKEEQ